jgi:hypothetical protein
LVQVSVVALNDGSMVIPWLVQLHQSTCLCFKVGLQVLLHPICDGLVSMGSDVSPILNAVRPDAADASGVDAVGPSSKIVNGAHQLKVTKKLEPKVVTYLGLLMFLGERVWPCICIRY